MNNGVVPTGSTGTLIDHHKLHSGKYRLNKYNWLAHKLIGQHQFKAFNHLRRHIIMACATASAHEATSWAPGNSANKDENRSAKVVKNSTIENQAQSAANTNQQHDNNNQGKISSDHFTYLHCLSLMRTTSPKRLDETLIALQQLDLERNSQHFLLLCQCLLYSGNFDSVAALCKQMINKQIDIFSYASTRSSQQATTQLVNPSDELVDLSEGNKLDQPTRDDHLDNEKQTTLNFVANNITLGTHMTFSHNSSEFSSLFKQVCSNHSINNPRLWCVFGRSLEYQRQFKDAQLAYQIATSLTNFKVLESSSKKMDDVRTNSDTRYSSQRARMCNYQFASLELAKFSIRHLKQYRHAELILIASSTNPLIRHNQNDIMLALTRATLNPSVDNLNNACDIIISLENHYYSRENPSAVYNQLAQRSSWFKTTVIGQQFTNDNTIGSSIFNECLSVDALDPRRTKPDMTLAKSCLLVSKWTAQMDREQEHKDKDLSSYSVSPGSIEKQITELIESIIDHDVTCHRSSGLWNNLGLLFLARRKLVASLSCLLKAHQIEPSNWRINLNLAIVSYQVGLITRANILALTAKNLQLLSRWQSYRRNCNSSKKSDPPLHSDQFVENLIGMCYDKLAN